MKLRHTALWAGVGVTSVAASPTLLNIPGIPSNEMKGYFSDEQWKMLERVPYAGYVHFTADVDDSGKLHRIKVEDTSPGDTWRDLAKPRLGKVVISAANIGSHIKPRASTWVIFYGPGKEDLPNGEKLVLIYAKPTKYNKTGAPGEIGERPYLEISTYK